MQTDLVYHLFYLQSLISSCSMFLSYYFSSTSLSLNLLDFSWHLHFKCPRLHTILMSLDPLSESEPPFLISPLTKHHGHSNSNKKTNKIPIYLRYLNHELPFCWTGRKLNHIVSLILFHRCISWDVKELEETFSGHVSTQVTTDVFVLMSTLSFLLFFSSSLGIFSE